MQASSIFLFKGFIAQLSQRLLNLSFIIQTLCTEIKMWHLYLCLELFSVTKIPFVNVEAIRNYNFYTKVEFHSSPIHCHRELLDRIKNALWDPLPLHFFMSVTVPLSTLLFANFEKLLRLAQKHPELRPNFLIWLINLLILNQRCCSLVLHTRVSHFNIPLETLISFISTCSRISISSFLPKSI